MWITTSPRLITMLLLFFHHTASLLLILAIKNEISVTTIDMILPCQNFSKSKTFNFLRKHCIIKCVGFQKNKWVVIIIQSRLHRTEKSGIEIEVVVPERPQSSGYIIITPGRDSSSPKSAKISSF